MVGTWHQWVYPVGAYHVEVTGEVVSDLNGLLHLGDVMIYPVNYSGAAPVGTGALMRALGQFTADLRAMGFSCVRLVGHRVAGAFPGRPVDLTISC